MNSPGTSCVQSEVSETAPLADGLDHHLDPRVIPLQQVTGAIVMAVVAFGSLVGVLVGVLIGGSMPAWLKILLLVLWLVMVILGAWHSYRWPVRAYAHTFYRVDEQGIEIRQGVYWRVVVNVPKSRVQHIDVSQGPIDRRFGLGTIAIYTAGTDYAKVALEGLEHGRALRIREHLLPSGTGDAV